MSKTPYKTGKQSCEDKSEQAGHAQSLPCSKHPTKLVNNPVKNKSEQAGLAQSLSMSKAPYKTGKQSC